MSIVEQISAPLQRPIKDGRRYNKFFRKTSCNATSLGNGKNNTIDGVEFMAQLIKQHAYQTKEIAKVLRGNSLQQTVNNIYNWLFNHIQYLADGQLQQLRSPDCAWSQRKEGIDCKSYTIFAMSILQNLGITAAIRQVRQPGFYSELWTHVYVIVPINQNASDFKKEIANGNYLVIDATKDRNTEVQFLEPKDKLMQAHKYVGMNAPTAGSVLVDFKNTVQQKFGFSEKTANQMVKYIRLMLENGLTLEQILIVPTYEGIYLGGLKENMLFEYPNIGLNASNGDEGIDWGKMTDWAGDFLDGWDLNFKDILDVGLSCIGSWYSPSQAKEDFAKDWKFMLEWSGLNKEINTTNYNKFSAISNMALNHAYFNSLNKKWAKCTREGIRARYLSIQDFRKKVDEVIKGCGYSFQRTGQKVSTKNLSVKMPGYHDKYENRDYDYTLSNVIPPANGGGCNSLGDDVISNPSSGSSSSGNGDSKTGSIGSIIDKVTDLFPSNGGKKKAITKSALENSKNINGSNSAAKFGGGLALIGVSLLAYPNIKKMLSDNKKTTPKNQSKTTKKGNTNATTKK